MDVSDAPVAETIEQLVAAGINTVVEHEWASSPGTPLPEEATPHTDVTGCTRREFPDVIRLRKRRTRRLVATTDPYFTLDLDSEIAASEVLTAQETPEPSSVEMADSNRFVCSQEQICSPLGGKR